MWQYCWKSGEMKWRSNMIWTKVKFLLKIVNSICELVELNTNAIMSGWRSIFACLKAVKIEQQRRSIEIHHNKDMKKPDEDETEQAGVELYRVNAILEVLEAFFSCENLNVISQASVDCLQCLFCYLREPGRWN